MLYKHYEITQNMKILHKRNNFGIDELFLPG